MIKINWYTARWNSACSAGTPKIGRKVLVDLSPDAREWDDFCHALELDGKDVYYVSSSKKWDRYEIVKRGETNEI